ncbi:MAG: phosphoribosylformylglycinamidine synthase subunit PurL [bacterium]|jgi:phosphoribosylformylglycinamidine synthase II
MAGDWQKVGLSQGEYEKIVSLLGREPNEVELGIFGVMWSEHCCYKNSKVLLRRFPTRGERVLQGPGENAGVVDIGDGLAVALKIESHNHPSAVEPYEGAATGIGGIVRDILAMGARPIALLDSLHFGDPADEEVDRLVKGVVAGAADYGNVLGVPTVGGELKFSSAYGGNPLVNVMCVGLMKKEALAQGVAAGPGNPVIVFGGKTGRDGIQGATFASEELGTGGTGKSNSVPAGDPATEKLLIEACLELLPTGAVVGIQDLGAAGLTSSSCEMASRAGTGIELDVALVPRREEGMTPYEVMLSESQERMLVVAQKGKEAVVEEILKKWNLDYAIIGHVIEKPDLVVKDAGEIAARIPIKAIVDEAPVYQREGVEPAYLVKAREFSPADLPEPANYNETLLKLLGSPNIASKEWVYKKFDHQTGSVLVAPGSDAAVLQIPGTNKAIALTTDVNGRHCYLDPYQGGLAAVAEAARNLVCAGAQPLALTDGLNFGSPEKPDIYWQLEQAVEGIRSACQYLQIPVVSGNVSLYNETAGQAVFPTPVVGMIGLLENCEEYLTQGFKAPGALIVLLGETREELGGSEYLAVCHGLVAGRPPRVDLEKEKRVQSLCLAAAKEKLLHSAHDCAEGGLLVTVAESCLTATPEPLGAKLDFASSLPAVSTLFAESHGRIVVSLPEEALPRLKELAGEWDVPLQVLGRVVPDRLEVSIKGTGARQPLIDIEVAALALRWGEGKVEAGN